MVPSAQNGLLEQPDPPDLSVEAAPRAAAPEQPLVVRDPPAQVRVQGRRPLPTPRLTQLSLGRRCPRPSTDSSDFARASIRAHPAVSRPPTASSACAPPHRASPRNRWPRPLSLRPTHRAPTPTTGSRRCSSRPRRPHVQRVVRRQAAPRQLATHRTDCAPCSSGSKPSEATTALTDGPTARQSVRTVKNDSAAALGQSGQATTRYGTAAVHPSRVPHVAAQRSAKTPSAPWLRKVKRALVPCTSSFHQLSAGIPSPTIAAGSPSAP